MMHVYYSPRSLWLLALEPNATGLLLDARIFLGHIVDIVVSAYFPFINKLLDVKN